MGVFEMRSSLNNLSTQAFRITCKSVWLRINYFICKPQFQHLYNIFYKWYKDNVNISIYRHLQKCLYKGLCPKLSTNFRLRNLNKIIYNQSYLFAATE